MHVGITFKRFHLDLHPAFKHEPSSSARHGEDLTLIRTGGADPLSSAAESYHNFSF